jgi:hypothetical protein
MVVMITDRHKSYKDDHCTVLSQDYHLSTDDGQMSTIFHQSPRVLMRNATSNWTQNSGLVIVGFSETWSAQGKPYREGETQIIH